ncbi:tol-Pal system protein TolA-like [Microplitis demolitor]|uniref:tol-Pal system protein TolA-like n=1 Tax=Microplitis demolitor TaxID=69319 RepID=UPI0004CDCA52|nr:tol-Pal system protein TolA-like [Microplitis demolitor]
MKTVLLIFVTIAVASVTGEQSTESTKKEKRGVAFLGSPGFDIVGVLPAFGQHWNPASFGGSFWPGQFSSDLALSQVQSQATHNVALQALKDSYPSTPSISYPPEVIRAIHSAKEANHNVLVAQHRVAEAKQAAVIQQKIALAKEAAAREAAQRSEVIAAQAQHEARASAQQLVALQQKLASLKDSVAAAQRVAAARETAAAAAIQRNAADTAAELRKQEVDKQITQTEKEAKVRDIVAAKEHAIANAVQHAAASKSTYPPWGR